MSDKIDKYIVIAGSVALAAVLSVGLLANSAAYPAGSNRDDPYPMTARTALWFGQTRHL
jgi:hypothetical protein